MSVNDVSKKLQNTWNLQAAAVHEASKLCHFSNELNEIFDKLQASDYLVCSYYTFNAKEMFRKLFLLDKFKHSESKNEVGGNKALKVLNVSF